jgi:predicted NUDIX family NTP pyrophosphohydrolase
MRIAVGEVIWGMVSKSAGILIYRFRAGQPEVFLVHPGGPFWVRKDAGAWGIPKGGFDDTEDPLAAARRELAEETGVEIDGNFIALQPIRQKGGKTVHAWVIEGDCDAAAIRSNTFEMEWPPKSGRMKEFPEVDRAQWFGMDEARVRILESQLPLLDQLQAMIARCPR